jgi:hypothetical protein
MKVSSSNLFEQRADQVWASPRSSGMVPIEATPL